MKNIQIPHDGIGSNSSRPIPPDSNIYFFKSNPIPSTKHHTSDSQSRVETKQGCIPSLNCIKNIFFKTDSDNRDRPHHIVSTLQGITKNNKMVDRGLKIFYIVLSSSPHQPPSAYLRLILTSPYISCCFKYLTGVVSQKCNSNTKKEGAVLSHFLPNLYLNFTKVSQ